MRFNQGFGFNGGGGGGGRDNSGTIRLLGNVALAIGLTYLSMTGQLGWIFDAIGWVLDIAISIWVCLSLPLSSALAILSHPYGMKNFARNQLKILLFGMKKIQFLLT